MAIFLLLLLAAFDETGLNDDHLKLPDDGMARGMARDGSFHNMASPVPPIQGFIHKPQLKILGCSMIFLAPQLKIA